MSGQKTVKKRTAARNGILRLFFVVVAFFLEGLFLFTLFASGLERYAEVVALILRILALLLVLGIFSQNKTASIKMPWIVLILVVPVIGVSLYLMVGLSGSTARMKRRFARMDEKLMPLLHQDPQVLARYHQEAASCEGISRYLLSQSAYPLYGNTKVTYYPDASEGLEAQKEAMRRAQHFIFMEYFAIEDAQPWRELEEILEERVRAGVEVRVFYDDFGSISFINTDFAKKLEKKGIRCRIFNPINPLFNWFLNNRDHRKMTIVDGTVGFTGGYNIANEYFNLTSPYGHWKDTGVRLEGEAVNAMTVTFLHMWNAVRADDQDDLNVSAYLPAPEKVFDGEGFVQFYADSPMDKKQIGEDVYLSMVERAQRYVYFITPYLILTDEMSRALGLAAKRGVDVRIITPGIPDKKIVYQLTRSYYSRLAADGVRVYEYTPGFCHAKMSLSDDLIATCGTINLDYRSLYHHFEDGCVMTACDAVHAIREDFDRTLEACREVTEKYRIGRSAGLRLGQLLLRLVAPLM